MTESYIAIGVFLLVDLVLVLLLPDTKGLTLPDTLTDVNSKKAKEKGKFGDEMEPVAGTITNKDSQNKKGETLLRNASMHGNVEV